MLAPSFHTMDVPVDDIYVVGERRPVDDGAVSRLAASVREIGLQTPITIRTAEVTDPESGELMTAYALIAGAHRLEAYKQLGRDRIPAVVRDCDEIDAELWEISENLHRLDLTKDQRDAQIRRFAELLGVKAAAAKTGQNVPFSAGGQGGPGRGNKGVAALVAEQTGLSKKTVQRALNPQPRPTREPKLADDPISDAEALERWLATGMSWWNKGSAEWRSEFMARLDSPVMDSGRFAA